MKKLTVIAPAADADLLLRRLMHLGCIEPICDLPDGCDPASFTELPRRAAEVAERVAHIDRVLPVLQARRSGRGKPRPMIEPTAFLQSEEAARARKTVTETEKLLDAIEKTKEELRREEALMHSLVPYLDFPYPLDGSGTKTTKFLLGRLPRETEEVTLQRLCDEVGIVASILCTDAAARHIAVITHRGTEEQAREALAVIGFEEASFACTNGRAVKIFDAAQKRTEQHLSQLSRFDARLNVLAENLFEVQILADVERVNEETARHAEKLHGIGSCVILTAWCPAYEAARVSKFLSGITAAFELSDPAPEEKPPCPANEAPYAGPLASLFATYRTPWFGKFHAAPLLTLFYALLFGLFFADAGFGLVFLAAFGIALLLLPPEHMLRRALPMLACCGTACLVFGILCGNYFGDLLQRLLSKSSPLLPAPALGAALTKLLALLRTPWLFLAVALAPAGLYLLTVLTLRTVRLCREKRTLEALLVVAPHLVFAVGVGLLWLHPIVGAAVISAALLAIVTVGIVVGSNARARLIAIGGRLLDLLLDLTHALSAARPLLLGALALPCLAAAHRVPTGGGKTLLLLACVIAVFAATHALQVAANRLPSLAKRAKLAFAARFADCYPHREILHHPLKLRYRYLTDVSVTARDEELISGEADDAMNDPEPTEDVATDAAAPAPDEPSEPAPSKAEQDDAGNQNLQEGTGAQDP
ncbi:MAG: hypothetical protein IJW51_01675 [Clostridia bacterium]|nr:hypothetical protein [Clostridia bacterium]